MDNSEILRKLPTFATIWIDSDKISEKACAVLRLKWTILVDPPLKYQLCWQYY